MIHSEKSDNNNFGKMQKANISFALYLPFLTMEVKGSNSSVNGSILTKFI